MTKSKIPQTRKMKKKTSLWANLAVLAATLTILLFAFEGMVRILFKDTIVMFPRNHAAAQYGDFTIRRITPNMNFWHTSKDGNWKFSTNAQGFRDNHDYQYAKPDGKVRIIALGDSHTQGFEVRQSKTYAKQLEKKLQVSKLNAEVMNTGISGFSTAEALVFLENEGLKYRPDVVLLGFYANDYADNIKAGLFKLKDGNLKIDKYQHTPAVSVIKVTQTIPGLKWLGENSYAYSMLFNAAWVFAKQRLLASSRAKYSNSEEKIQSNIEYAVAVEKASDYEIELTNHLLERLGKTCQHKELICIFIDIPQIGDDEKPKPSAKTETMDIAVTEFSDIIDTKDILKNIPEINKVHVPNGHRHISEATHESIATELSKRIKRLTTEK